jgi:LmbE family N-acetylglucosaminyl deacetylase
MLTPVTAEETWLTSLVSTPHWLPPARPTIVISPHPDDETLGAGGLIAYQRRRGIPVVVVAVTDGEAAYGNSPGLGDLRREEQNRALAELGVDSCRIVRLGLPDSAVTGCEAELTNLLLPLVERDTLVLAPWSLDPHPDHEASGRAAEVTAGRRGAALVSYVFWTWHHRTAKDLDGLPLVRFVLDEQIQSARAAAIAHYHSQLVHSGGTPILPDLLLSPARRSFESFILHA